MFCHIFVVYIDFFVYVSQVTKHCCTVTCIVLGRTLNNNSFISGVSFLAAVLFTEWLTSVESLLYSLQRVNYVASSISVMFYVFCKRCEISAE